MAVVSRKEGNNCFAISSLVQIPSFHKTKKSLPKSAMFLSEKV